jgi:hypothetical protein
MSFFGFMRFGEWNAVFLFFGSGSNPFKKTPLPPGEGNIRINGFEPPPVFSPAVFQKRCGRFLGGEKEFAEKT